MSYDAEDVRNEFGPCSCQDSGKCKYVNGGPACMNEESLRPLIMSDTPRTDIAVKDGQDYWGEYVEPDFARQLERELASTQRMLADCYEAQRIGAQYAAPQASNGSPQGSGVGQRQTAPLLGKVAESDNAPAAVAASRKTISLDRALHPENYPPLPASFFDKTASDEWTDWQTPVMKGYLMECCDCGLVHEIEFRIGKVTEIHADGKGWEGELMPDGEYRVQMRLRRA